MHYPKLPYDGRREAARIEARSIAEARARREAGVQAAKDRHPAYMHRQDDKAPQKPAQRFDPDQILGIPVLDNLRTI